VHLESSLEALKLWDEQDPPTLLSVEELSFPEGYGLSLTFAEGGVSFARWEASLDRLGRFFGPDLQAALVQQPQHQLTLTLQPRVSEVSASDPTRTLPAS
jgi:hypothetical protein